MVSSRPLVIGLAAAAWIAAAALSGCARVTTSAAVEPALSPTPTYQIGSGDNLKIFVWRNDDLSTEVPVRPDGRISLPLVPDMPAAGKTPTQLAADIQSELRSFVQEPVVTVIVTSFTGPYAQQVRVLGQVAKPQAVTFRDDMSVLDAVIAVGGLTNLAAGNRASIIRKANGEDIRIPVALDDIMDGGDLSANRKLHPGDIILVPESWF